MTDLRPVFLTTLIDEANDGYAESAYEALGMIASLLDDGAEIPQEAKVFLISSFLQISKRKQKAHQALKLNGRKKLSNKNRDVRLAQSMYWAIDGGSTLKKEASKHGLSYESAREIFYKYKKTFDATYDHSNY